MNKPRLLLSFPNVDQTIAKASRAGAMHPCRCLPEEIVVCEILVRLPPKSLLRCRAVCRNWHRATSIRSFLLAHHGRQPSLPIVWGEPVSASKDRNTRYEDFLTFDYRAADAHLLSIARFNKSYCPRASCDGLLILSKRGTTGTCLSVCNPITHEHAPISTPPWNLSLMGMYMHRATGEYRLLLLLRRTHKGPIAGSHLPKDEIGCYVFELGSDQPPSYIGGPEAATVFHFDTPALLCDRLHWFPLQHQSETIWVFDTISESFRQIRTPVVRTRSNIFEMDGTLGIYTYNDAMKVIYTWVLQNYEDEIWEYKYRVELPVSEISRQLESSDDYWDASVVWGHDDILLMVSYGGWMFYVNTDGELVDSFHRDGQHIYSWKLRLKQTLVPHNFFTAHKICSMNASPFL